MTSRLPVADTRPQVSTSVEALKRYGHGCNARAILLQAPLVNSAWCALLRSMSASLPSIIDRSLRGTGSVGCARLSLPKRECSSDPRWSVSAGRVCLCKYSISSRMRRRRTILQGQMESRMHDTKGIGGDQDDRNDSLRRDNRHQSPSVYKLFFSSSNLSSNIRERIRRRTAMFAMDFARIRTGVGTERSQEDDQSRKKRVHTCRARHSANGCGFDNQAREKKGEGKRQRFRKRSF
jgi:hypothetical protein